MKRSKRKKKSSIYAIVERRPPNSVTRSPAARVAHCPTHSGSTQSFSPVGHSAVFAGKEKPSCRKRGRERMPKTNNKKGCQGKRRTARLPSSSPLPWKSVPFFFFRLLSAQQRRRRARLLPPPIAFAECHRRRRLPDAGGGRQQFSPSFPMVVVACKCHHPQAHLASPLQLLVEMEARAGQLWILMAFSR